MTAHNQTNVTLNLQQNETLARRGVLEQARAMGWNAYAHNGRPGWSYPVYDLDGDSSARRWKNYDSNGKPKYLWIGGGRGVHYYHTPDLGQAVRDAGGVLYLAAGEIDLLTFRAAGLNNVVSFFGEALIPSGFVGWLDALGVAQLVTFPDRDDTGIKSAIKLRDALSGSGVHLEVLALPGDVGDKGDTNDLWQLVGFDSAAFVAALETCARLDLPAPTPRPKRRRARRTAAPGPLQDGAPVRWDDERALWLERVVKPALDSAAPIVKPYKGDGWRHSPDPARPDDNPSFRISYDIHGDGVPMDASGPVDGGWRTVAAWLGLPSFMQWWRDNRAPASAPATPSSSSARPAPVGKNVNNGAKRYTPAARTDADLPGDALQTGAATVPTGGNRRRPPAGFPVDLLINAPYLSDADLPGGDLLINSDTGTGKTTWAKQQFPDGSLCVPTHRIKLNRQHARAFNAGDYTQLGDGDRLASDRIVITPNSIKSLVGSAGVRAYDAVYIDEVEQVLAHTVGETIKDHSGTLQVLEQIVKQARRVVATDAHAGALAYNWLKALRPDVTTVFNERPRDRGTLQVYDDKHDLFDALDLWLVKHPGETAALACSSRKLLLQAARRFEALYPGAVLAVHQHVNPDDEQVNGFLANPDDHTRQYRLICYTTTMGSGIDIQTPIGAVFGLFGPNPLTATECQQMTDRFRNRRETHIWLPNPDKPGDRPDDADQLERDQLATAIRTGNVSHFDDNGIPVTTPAQRHQLALWAKVQAARNTSLNRLRDEYLALAYGYTTVTSGAGSAFADALQDELEALRLQLDKEEREAVCSAEPVDGDTYQHLQRTGAATSAHRHGFQRWKIERVAGRDVNDLVRVAIEGDTPDAPPVLVSRSVYSLLQRGPQRAALRRFVDARYRSYDELKESDRMNARDALPIRKHRTQIKALFDSVTAFLFDGRQLDAATTWTRDDLEQLAHQLIALNDDLLRSHFGLRSDSSTSGPALVRRVMERYGLKITSEQRMENGKRYRVYHLDSETLALWNALSASHERARKARITQNPELQSLGVTGFEQLPPPPAAKRPTQPALLPEQPDERPHLFAFFSREV